MKFSSRFFLYAPLGLFLLLAAGAALHWWFAASVLAARLDAVNGHEVMPGVTMQFASRRISGFPFNLDSELGDAAFAIATPQGVTRWHADKLALHALTYGRDETIFEAAGPQSLSWSSEDGKPRSLNFAVGSLRASAILDGSGLKRFDLDLVGFGSPTFTAQRLQFHIRRNGSGKLDLLVVAEDVRAPVAICPGFGGQPFHTRQTGTVTAAEVFSPLLAGRQNWQEAVAAWRAAYGRTNLEKPLASIPAEKLAAITGLGRALCEAH
jgi:hypothetical protein